MFRYIIVEDIETVSEGIALRMKPFSEWQNIGMCSSVTDAASAISIHEPHLIFLDWNVKGGSAYEILEAINSINKYQPYIIFNTAYTRDNPEIPQQIFNSYRVDKYLVKPIWKNLSQNLTQYVKEATTKAQKSNNSKQQLLSDVNGKTTSINLEDLSCIIQHHNGRAKELYFISQKQPIIVSKTWQECFELLEANNTEYFVSNKRQHLIVKKYIMSYHKPILRLVNFSAYRIEIVKESLKDFEGWLKN